MITPYALVQDTLGKMWRRRNSLCRIFSVASAINIAPPPYNQDKAALVTWSAENSEVYRAGHFLAGLAFLLFYFPFFAGFCERLREAEVTPAIWSRVAWAGAIMSPAAGTMAGTLWIVVLSMELIRIPYIPAKF